VGEEGVAEEHGGVGAMRAVGGVGSVALIGAVEDVVVDERGEVDELDDGRAADQVDGRADAGAGPESKEGTEAFTRMSEHLSHHRTDLRFETGLLFREERLEGREVRFQSEMEG
jgi:hypothetical protein